MPAHLITLLRTNLISKIFFLLLILIFAGCGWHLRGYEEKHNTPEKINLKFSQRNSSLVTITKQILDRQGIENSQDSKIKLSIDREIIDKRPLSYTVTGIPAQYQIVLRLEYSINDSLSRKNVTVTRNYDFDPSRISSETQEEDELIKEMRREAIHKILRSL